MNVIKADKKKRDKARRIVARERQQRAMATGLNILPVAGSVYNATQAKEGRKGAAFGRNMGRKFVEQTAASVPGMALAAGGVLSKNPTLISAGAMSNRILRPVAAAHSGNKAMENAQLRGDIVSKPIKKGMDMSVSAFGVSHDDEISKVSLQPIKNGIKAMKFGNMSSAPRAAAAGYKSGIKRGLNPVQAGIKGASNFARRSPGAAFGVAGAGATGVGGAGYVAGRRSN